MFSWIHNFKIGTRMLAGLMVPIGGLVFFAGVNMFERLTIAQEMQRVHALAELAPTVSNLVHEMQKERVRSAGFIGSKGKSFADSLPAQRQETTAKRIEAETALTAFDFGAYDASLQQAADTALASLDKLEANRAAVDRFDLTVPEMAKYYTGTIMALLGTIEAIERASTDDAISKEISGYLSLLQGKERAGLERAMGAVGFGSGAFKPAIYNNLVRLIGAQDIYFTTFKLYADDAEAAFFDQTLTGAAVDEVARMREIALASRET